MYESIGVYPALVEMYRIVLKLQQQQQPRSIIIRTGNSNYDYTLTILVFICVIGGGSNIAASYVSASNRYVTGYSTVIAASLGYYQRIASVRTAIMLSLWGQDLTAGRLYWSHIGYLVLMNNDWYPPLLAWLLAGLGGSLFAKYQLENIVFFDGIDIFKFLGLT
jgi:hypothetical protein